MAFTGLRSPLVGAAGDLSDANLSSHDIDMRTPWSKSKAEQLELLDTDPDAPRHADRKPAQHDQSVPSTRSSTHSSTNNHGHPLDVSLDRLDEDPNNPRTEFPDSEIDELADDIRARGILQPIVVHPADAAGRYCIHFGTKRLRAARRAGLSKVPVIVRDAPADPYAQVAENQKRHGLTPLDLARLMRARVDKGESNAAIAKRLVMDPTTVAHHLALLDLPPELDRALKSGRCTSPRTLYELGKLHQSQPEQAKALLAGGSEVTRAVVAAVRAQRGAASLLVQANGQCARLKQTLNRIEQVEQQLDAADLATLRQRVTNLASRSA